MSDIALLMTGVLNTGQPSPQILPEQLLVELNNFLENSTQRQLSQIVPTAQITPPEFMEPDGSLLVASSALTLKNKNILSNKVLLASSSMFKFQAATGKTAASSRRPKQKLVADANQRVIGKQFGNEKFAGPDIPTVRFGNSGVAVRVLQRLLSSNGYNIQVDGVFGALTEAAVKAFQNRRSIVADGVVGQRTWRELTR